MFKIIKREYLLRNINIHEICAYSFMSIISLLIFLRDIVGFSINKYIFITIATIAFILVKSIDIYYYYLKKEKQNSLLLV